VICEANANNSLCANPATYFRNKYNGQYIADRRASTYRSLDLDKLDRSIKKATKRLLALTGMSERLRALDRKNPPCGKEINCTDPESIVRYFLLKKVDPKYADLKNKTFSEEFESLNSFVGYTLTNMPEFSNGIMDYTTDDPSKKIRSDLIQAKKNLILFLDGSLVDKSTRETFQADIESVTIQVKDNQDSNGELFGYESADFDILKNKISIGIGHAALKGNHLSSIGHELGHRIDPCYESHHRMFAKGESSPAVPLSGSKYPFKEVVKCLRSSESVAALPVGTTSTDALCVPFQDKINEAFCDWVGVETLIKGVVENPKLSTSEKKAIIEEELVFGATRDDKFFYGTDRDVHSSFEDRINKIYFAHPKIRDLFGCLPKKDLKYCEPPKRFKQPANIDPKSSLRELGTK
jgi:hypothetical protein